MKLKRGIIFILITALCVSCNYLDFDETNNLNTREDVYRYFGQVEQVLTTVYSYMPQDLGAIGGAMRDCATDDAEFGDTGADIQKFNNGRWSALQTVDSSWELYIGIRAANEFLKSVQDVDLSRYQYDHNYKNWMRKLKNFPLEARILRATFFFELARRYGDIAMPLTMLTTDEANTLPKTTFTDAINFIVSECDACMELPVDYRNEPDAQIGRVTKGYAMALKSKALLYAASKLHNPAMNSEKWKISAKAALDLINANLYQLDRGDKVNNLNSKEVVLFRMNGDNQNFEMTNFPIRFTEGRKENVRNSVYPSQNLVDAFETLAGYRVVLGPNGWECEDPKFNPQNPYAGRDPRFAKTVLANGMSFKNSTIETFVGGKDDLSLVEGGSVTGYFLRKYVQESTSFTPDNIVSNKHHWVIYRYAETLLTYAEAMVQAFGDPDYKDDIYTLSAREALNQVRTNAGMPAVKATEKNAFITAVEHEWRVEFAFEDHRFWDVRRWKNADKSQKELYGVKITKLNEHSLQFQRILYESRLWNDRMYLFPIPQAELFKNTNLNPQNSGW